MRLRSSKVRRKIGAEPVHVLKCADKMKGQGVSNFKAIVVNKTDAGQSVALADFDAHLDEALDRILAEEQSAG